MTEKVFVYGSLKRGGRIHAALDGAKYLGTWQTKHEEYHLLDLGAFPAMITGGDHIVEGEMYLVDESIMERLDMIECGAGYYRQRIEVQRVDDEASIESPITYLFGYESVKLGRNSYTIVYPEHIHSNIVKWFIAGKDYPNALSN